MSEEFDFDGFGTEDTEEFKGGLEELVAFAEEAVEIDLLIKALEQELKEITGRYEFLTRSTLPSGMRKLGLDDFKLTDGSKVKITEGVTASQLDEGKEYFEFAKQFIIDNDAGDLLKTKVETEFGRGSHNEALALAASLREQGFDVKAKETIHAQTYKSFGNNLFQDYRDKIENGEIVDEPPFKELGMFVVRQAKVTAAKKGKK